MRTAGAVLLGVVSGAVVALALFRLSSYLVPEGLSFSYGALHLFWLPLTAWTIGALLASAIATAVAKRGPVAGVITGLLIAVFFCAFAVVLPFPLWMAAAGVTLQLIVAFAAAWIIGRSQSGPRTRWGIIIALVAVGCMVWGAAWWRGYLPIRVDDLAFVSLESFHSESDRDNLHLRFRSNQNLRSLVNRSGAYGAWAVVSLCPFHKNPTVSLGRVGHNDVDLGTTPTHSCAWKEGVFAGCSTAYDTPQVHAEIASEGDTTGPFFYDVYFGYFDQMLEYKSYGTASRFIPLPKEPQDLCVQVHGDGGPPGLVSNVFVIPKVALVRALGGFTPSPLTPQTWKSEPQRFACEPRERQLGQPILLQLGPDHGSELYVHRLADDTWFLLLSISRPDEMRGTMTPREYDEAKHMQLPADTNGYEWWSANGHLEKVFTKPGPYPLFAERGFRARVGLHDHTDREMIAVRKLHPTA
jgi:hypothetical protein